MMTFNRNQKHPDQTARLYMENKTKQLSPSIYMYWTKLDKAILSQHRWRRPTPEALCTRESLNIVGDNEVLWHISIDSRDDDVGHGLVARINGVELELAVRPEHVLRAVAAGNAAEDDAIEEGVASETVVAVDSSSSLPRDIEA